MAKHLPDYHSPLIALGKKVLLWMVLPAALVLIALYVVDGELPARQKVRRVAQEIEKKRVEELSKSPVVAKAEKLKQELLAEGKGMSKEELKRVAAMGNRERNEYVRKMNEEAEKRLAANPAATASGATACGLTTFQVAGQNAEFVATRTGLKDPYTDLKIVLKSGMTVPKGSVVIDPYSKVVAECRAETCTEFKLDITGESMVPGILDVKLSPNTAAAEAYVYPSINGVNEINCLRGKTPTVAP